MIAINNEMFEYSIEPLAGNRVIYVSPHSRFGTDAVLLADFASPRRNDIAADLCTGGGIIPLLWLSGDAPRAKVTGLELQGECCALARMSIEANGDSDRFEVIEGDLREAEKYLPREKCSLVTCNPPYFPAGSGFANKSEERTIARSEVMCDSYDVCRAARYLLKYGGRLCLCQRPERLTDVICAMREQGIEPKKLRLVQQRAGSEPWLVLAEGRRGGKPGVKFLPVLTVEDGNGNYSDEMRNIYGRYGDKSKWQDN
ncbi:MAG: tRNA1(Val) (adenine(37)-N6)-methyltransferase [Clostridia bacterium]|nr:tRNA1(Val) (adenine(37)-N6)-methyltransferase [Clostridia bacterium]